MTVAKDSTLPYDTVSTTTTQSLLERKCCFFIPLRLGCFILGYLNLIYNVLQTMGLVIVTVYLGITTHGFNHIDGFRPPKGVNESIQTIEIFRNEEKHFLNQVGIILVIIMVTNLAWVIVNICCLVGLHMRSPGPVKVYLGFAALRLCLSLASLIYAILNTSEINQLFISHGIDLGFGGYFIYLYYVFAKQLKRERESALIPPREVTEKKNIGLP